MAQAISVEIYQLLEEKIGREEAKRVASAIELGLDVIEKKAEAVALPKKLELKDELTKELATKADLQLLEAATKADLQLLKAELRGEMKELKTELQGEIHTLKIAFEKLNQKFNFMIVLLIIALTLMNPVAAGIIQNLLKP